MLLLLLLVDHLLLLGGLILVLQYSGHGSHRCLSHQ
jgi:hypothetical protein